MAAMILHILLLILKIIGITLGILIGTVIILLCLVMCVPVRYSIEAERTEKEGSPPVEIVTKATWLFHFINMRIEYSTELKVRLRVLFITLFRIPAKAKKTGGRDFGSKDTGHRNRGRNSDSINSGGYNEAENVDYDSQQHSEKISAKTNKRADAKDVKNTDTKSDGIADIEADEMADIEAAEKTDNTKFAFKDKLFKIYDFFRNIRYTINKICDKIKGIFENIEYYLDIIKGEEFKASFSLCKDELFSIFSYIRPRKINAEFVVGTGDPASTGQVLAYFYGLVYPFLGPDVSLEGDFDNKRIEGFAIIKGRVKLFTFIKAVIRIYFNKDIRALLKLFNKED